VLSTTDWAASEKSSPRPSTFYSFWRFAFLCPDLGPARGKTTGQSRTSSTKDDQEYEDSDSASAIDSVTNATARDHVTSPSLSVEMARLIQAGRQPKRINLTTTGKALRRRKRKRTQEGALSIGKGKSEGLRGQLEGRAPIDVIEAKSDCSCDQISPCIQVLLVTFVFPSRGSK